MSITAIIAIVIAVVSAILGGLAGRGLGKSAGRKEGAEQASQQQQVTQAKETVKAIQERTDVEKKVADSPRADIDRELSEFNRPD